MLNFFIVKFVFVTRVFIGLAVLPAITNHTKYADCPSFRGINVSTFQSIYLVMTYNYFLNKNIWTYISSLYLIIINHHGCADRLNPD